MQYKRISAAQTLCDQLWGDEKELYFTDFKEELDNAVEQSFETFSEYMEGYVIHALITLLSDADEDSMRNKMLQLYKEFCENEEFIPNMGDNKEDSEPEPTPEPEPVVIRIRVKRNSK